MVPALTHQRASADAHAAAAAGRVSVGPQRNRGAKVVNELDPCLIL